jgi:uroporphyrinogen-III decarboxylase
LEPPPDGDVELLEAREILGAETVLIGNIEERLFEIGSRTDIEKQVKKAVKQVADNGGFILCPTAMPISTPLKKKIQQNIIHYINCGLKYGQL